MPYSRTQTELKNDLEVRVRDPGNNRWPETEVYAAINSALNVWSGRNVKIPFLYTIPGGWSANEREYALPYYVTRPLDPQINITNRGWWSDIPAYSLLAGSGNTMTIVLGYYPPSTDGRIIYWAPNSNVPTTVPTQSGTIDSDDTSMVVTTIEPVGVNGYVKVDDEWIQYSGAVRGATTTTLSNLVRGCLGTTAASHTSATVNWGIVVHRLDLIEQMMSHCIMFLHSLFNQSANNTEKDLHQWNIRWESPIAKDFWKTYTPWRGVKVRQSRASMGDIYAPGLGRNEWRQGDLYGLW